MIENVKDIKEMKLDEFLSYLEENLTDDCEKNPSLDMSSLDYSSLYQRLMQLACQQPTVDSIMSLMIVGSIMLATNCCTEDSREYVLAITMLYTYLVSTNEKYSVSDINQQLITRYNFLVDNCKLSRHSITTEEKEN